MGNIYVSRTWCEYSRNPLGIDTISPRMSWTLESSDRNQVQRAYQIIVSTSFELAENEKGDAWDSGKIASDQSANAVLPDNLSFSGKRYWWRVRIWDSLDEPSQYSQISTFEFGLLHPKDWRGTWIGGAKLLRGTFSIGSKEIRSARVYVVGLGFYELSVNGD